MREPNPDKLNELVGKLVGDLGAAIAGAGILLVTALASTRRWQTGNRSHQSNLPKNKLARALRT